MATPRPLDHSEATARLTAEILLTLTRTVMKQVTNVVEGQALSLTQFRILQMLSHMDHLATELACKLEMSLPNISGIVDGLVRRGLVERSARSQDRRTIPLRITPAGHAALEAANTRAIARMIEILHKLPPEDLCALRQAMAALERALGETGDGEHDA